MHNKSSNVNGSKYNFYQKIKKSVETVSGLLFIIIASITPAFLNALIDGEKQHDQTLYLDQYVFGPVTLKLKLTPFEVTKLSFFLSLSTIKPATFASKNLVNKA